MITENEILERMTSVIEDILEIPELILKPDMTAKDIEGWDSLAHIEIIVGMEYEFGVKFKLAEVKSLENISNFVELIKAKVY